LYRNEPSWPKGDFVDEEHVSAVVAERLKLSLDYLSSRSFAPAAYIFWATAAMPIVRSCGLM